MAENLEFMGERSLFERALGLFACVAVEPLAERIVEGLCLETRAQGGVLWVLAEDGDVRAGRGARDRAGRRRAGEARPGELPAELPTSGGSLLAPADRRAPARRRALFVPLRREGGLIGVVRLTDKLEGDAFDDIDRRLRAEVRAPRRGRARQRAALRRAREAPLADPTIGAYTSQYFQDVVRNEIEKANRFGRSFALVELELGPLDELRREAGEAGPVARWPGVAEAARARCCARPTCWRRTASAASACCCRRPTPSARPCSSAGRSQALAASELFTRLGDAARPDPADSAPPVYPRDGTTAGDAAARARRARRGGAAQPRAPPGPRPHDARRRSADAARAGRAGAGARRPTRSRASWSSEVGRRPLERGLLYAAPGVALDGAVREGLEALRGVATRTELVVIADGERPRFDEPAGELALPPDGFRSSRPS